MLDSSFKIEHQSFFFHCERGNWNLLTFYPLFIQDFYHTEWLRFYLIFYRFAIIRQTVFKSILISFARLYTVSFNTQPNSKSDYHKWLWEWEVRNSIFTIFIYLIGSHLLYVSGEVSLHVFLFDIVILCIHIKIAFINNLWKSTNLGFDCAYIE